MEDDIRADLDAAFVDDGAASPAPPPAPAPVEAPAPAEPAPPSAPLDPAATLVAPTPAPPPEGTPAAPVDPNAAAPADAPIKPPGTWTPAAREHWANLPQEVRDEVNKREREISRGLSHSTQARQFVDEFSQTMQPYLGFIAAEKSTPIQAVKNMMETAAILRVGTPAQKVQIAASVIRDFGIDLVALDQMLASPQQPRQAPQQDIRQIIQQELAPILQERQSQQLSAVDQELQQFAAKNEFYNDVRDEMADMIEMAARKGHAMGLQTAYERAILLSEPVRRIVEERKARGTATANHQTAQRARQAAGSVQPSAVAGKMVVRPDDSLRGALESAFDSNTQGE